MGIVEIIVLALVVTVMLIVGMVIGFVNMLARLKNFTIRVALSAWQKAKEFIVDLVSNWRAATILSFAVIGLASFGAMYLAWSPYVLLFTSALIVYLLAGEATPNEVPEHELCQEPALQGA
jgi:hypothetical protein